MMSFYQNSVLLWAAHQSPVAGLAILGAGLLFGFYGVRAAPLMFALFAGLVGYFAGAAGAMLMGMEPTLPAYCVAAAFFLGALRVPSVAQLLCAGLTWGIVGAYFLDQFGCPGLPALVAAGLCGAIGLTMSVVCRRGMRILLTSLHGALLMVLGAQAIAAVLQPAIGNTFRQWSAHNVLVLPIILGMVTTMCYSVQCMVAQGDITSGPQGDEAIRATLTVSTVQKGSRVSPKRA